MSARRRLGPAAGLGPGASAPEAPAASLPAAVEYRGDRLAHERGSRGRAAAYAWRNPALPIGLVLFALLAAFTVLGYALWPVEQARPLSGLPSLRPSARHPFGTDPQGRDILAMMIRGTWITLSTGLFAAALGTAIGATLGFVAGYFGGWVDAAINWLVDVLLTIPAILVLVVIATSVQGRMTSFDMALIIALLAWRRPTRQVRAQVLVLRGMGYVNTARLSGMSNLEIIVRELMPNLVPYLLATFVLATSAAILAAVGLQAMGLGPQHEPTLGLMLHSIINSSAFLLGMWWWILPPIVVLVVVFLAFYLISAGLDEFANPRLRARI